MRWELNPQRAVEAIVALCLIVILAVIVYPRFLGAQLTEDLVKVYRDFEALDKALKSFHADRGVYFREKGSNPADELSPLTTPVAYIERLPNDPFRGKFSRYRSVTSHYDYTIPVFAYTVLRDTPNSPQFCVLASLGPDTDEDRSGQAWNPQSPQFSGPHVYHTSNGLNSSGDLYRLSWLDHTLPPR